MYTCTSVFFVLVCADVYICMIQMLSTKLSSQHCAHDLDLNRPLCSHLLGGLNAQMPRSRSYRSSRATDKTWCLIGFGKSSISSMMFEVSRRL